MKLSISGAIESDHEMGRRVRRASQILEEIAPTSQSVTADWAPARDADGRLQIILALSDEKGARADVRFAPEDLANEARLRARFYRIWGDLLQDRSHKMLDVLLGAGRSEK